MASSASPRRALGAPGPLEWSRRVEPLRNRGGEWRAIWSHGSHVGECIEHVGRGGHQQQTGGLRKLGFDLFDELTQRNGKGQAEADVAADAGVQPSNDL